MAHSQKVPYEGRELHQIIPARRSCVTNVLCNWDINSQIIKNVCVIILGPIVQESPKSLPALESKKCPKQSRNNLQSPKIDSGDCFETVSDTFWTPGPAFPGGLFGDSFIVVVFLSLSLYIYIYIYLSLSLFFSSLSLSISLFFFVSLPRRARETSVRGGRGCNTGRVFATQIKGNAPRDSEDRDSEGKVCLRISG